MKMENVEVAPINETKFLDLNDDCINAVLLWLPLKDLNSISFTCKRIYQLSDDVYRRQHFETVWVRLEPNENFETSESLNWNERYVFVTDSPIPKRFISEIPNLYIYSSWSLDLFKFIKTNCCRNLKRLRFNYQNNSYNCQREYGELIKDQLSTVEWLRADLFSDENFHNTFLQFCGNLTHLHLVLGHFTGKSWLTQVYPKLASLELFGWDGLIDSEAVEAFKNFIERNAQLDSIDCNVSLIATMSPTIPKVKQLKLSCENFNDVGNLNRCCSTGSIEWLDINVKCQISIEKFVELADVKSLRGIHVCIYDEESEKLSALQRMTELREMEMEFNKSVCQIASMLPNLTRIVNLNLNQFEIFTLKAEDINDLLMPFVKNSKKLKELHPRRGVYGLTFQNLMEMDSARSMLVDAEKLSIYLYAYPGSIPVSLLNGNLASLKFIQIKFYSEKYENFI